jgi:hypothetical protein
MPDIITFADTRGVRRCGLTNPSAGAGDRGASHVQLECIMAIGALKTHGLELGEARLDLGEGDRGKIMDDMARELFFQHPAALDEEF